jgi:glycosyltransferase involved in cell wall biosynthesis
VIEPLITMVVPVYSQPEMLKLQIRNWDNQYDEHTFRAFKFIVIDDGSPVPAVEVFKQLADEGGGMLPDLYRIDQDVPWNRGMARNLGTQQAKTPWVLHVDTDHVLPSASAAKLISMLPTLDPKRWYRFKRIRVGKADETRKKDKVDPNAEFVEIHPHIDSYLCTPDAYWRAGGYNEDFSGVLGGGSPFLKEMEQANGPPIVLSVALHVYTRSEVPDSSERTLPRDPAAFKNRKAEIMKAFGTLRGHDPVRLKWHQVF